MKATDSPHTRNPWAILAVLCLGLFVILLDGTIVNVAIPHIMGSFATGLSSVEWVINGYVLVFAVLLVTLGRFGDLYGRRRLFVGGMIVFTLASLACGLAPSIGALIACRVVQGAGASAMMPGTLSIIPTVFPPERRGAAMGVWGGVAGLATAIGPSLGGLIVDAASWRWIFLINIPLGILGVVLALRIVPESKSPAAVETLDLPGVGLFTAALFCLTFALVEGQTLGWNSPTILTLLAAVLPLFVLFCLRERRVSQPLVELSLFRNLTFVAGNLTGFFLSAAMMGVFFTVPIFLQTVLGYSALHAGLVMSPMSIMVMIAAPLAGRLSDRISGRWIVAGGMFCLAFGIAWLAGLTPWQEALTPTTALRSLILPFLIAGLGIGLATAPITAAVMSTVPRDRIGNASGVLSTMRQVGSLLGIAILGAVLQNRVTANVTDGIRMAFGMPRALKEKILAGIAENGVQMGGSTFGGSEVPPAVAGMISSLFKGWFTAAINTAFLVGVALAVAGCICALLLRKQRPTTPPTLPG